MDDLNDLFVEDDRFSLPSINTISKYTVKELKDDLETYYLQENKQPTKDSLLYHAILLVTYKYTKNKIFGKDQAFAEFRDKEKSGFFFETTPIPIGCMSAVSVACTRRLFKRDIEDTTLFGLAKVLDRYDDDSMTLEDPGGIGAALLSEVRYALLDELRSIKSADITPALKTKFKKILDNSTKFDFDGEEVSLKNPKLCDKEEKYETIEKAVYAVDPWYGTQSIYSTAAIEQLFTLSFCVKIFQVNFLEIFDIVTKKIGDFLFNTPMNLDSYNIYEDDDDSKPIENDYSELQEHNPEVDEGSFYYEQLVHNFLTLLDSKDIKILFGSINGNTLEEMEMVVELKKSSIDERKKKVMKKLQEYFHDQDLDESHLEGFYSALRSFETAKSL